MVRTRQCVTRVTIFGRLGHLTIRAAPALAG